MPVRKILQYPQEEAKLRQVSEPVRKLDKPTRRLIRDLKDTLNTEEGAGLAAPQIGVHKRVVLVCFGQDDDAIQPPLTLINPEIIERGPTRRSFDGCLSMPGLATWDSQRPAWLVFTAYDENWEIITQRVEGADAAVVDHEIDHLNGVLFIDRLPQGAQLYVGMIDDDGEEVMVPLEDTLGTSSRLP